MKMKKIGLFTALMVLVLVVGACGNSNDKASESSSAVGSSEAVSGKAETIEVIDANGDTKEVPVNPQKVVVFDMGMLDTIDALGAADRVVGVAKDSLPEYLKASFDNDDVQTAGSIKEPDMELINSMSPDLIIISGRQSDYEDQLSTIAPTLYLGTDYTDIWNSIQSNVMIIGQIFDKEAEAKEQLKDLSDKIDGVKARAEKSDLTGLTVLVNEGQLSAYGAGSRFGMISDVLGVKQADENIEASTHGQSVSFEYALEKNPDILFVVDRTKAIGGDDSNDNISENELIKQTNAAKEDKIVQLSPDIWYLSGGGLESTTLMVDEVSKVLE